MERKHARSSEFTVNRLFMKIFRTGFSAGVRECQKNFNFSPTESQLEIRTTKFLQAFSATNNTLCLLFKQRRPIQSRSLTVYLVNTNRTSFVVLVSWHAHYVVTNELICSTSCSLCTMFLCFFVFDFFRAFCNLCYSVIVTSFMVSKSEYIWRSYCRKNSRTFLVDAFNVTLEQT